MQTPVDAFHLIEVLVADACLHSAARVSESRVGACCGTGWREGWPGVAGLGGYGTEEGAEQESVVGGHVARVRGKQVFQ